MAPVKVFGQRGQQHGQNKKSQFFYKHGLQHRQCIHIKVQGNILNSNLQLAICFQQYPWFLRNSHYYNYTICTWQLVITILYTASLHSLHYITVPRNAHKCIVQNTYEWKECEPVKIQIHGIRGHGKPPIYTISYLLGLKWHHVTWKWKWHKWLNKTLVTLLYTLEGGKGAVSTSLHFPC